MNRSAHPQYPYFILPAERFDQFEVDVESDVTGGILGQNTQHDVVGSPIKEETNSDEKWSSIRIQVLIVYQH